MTCVVGLREGCQVILAADHELNDGYAKFPRKTPKVFRAGTYAIGVAGAPSVNAAVRYRLSLPDPPTRVDHEEAERFVATDVLDAYRTCLDDARLVREVDGYPMAGPEDLNARLLVAFGPHLIVIDESFAVYAPARPWAAIGTGADAALGALSITHDGDFDPTFRVVGALKAAIDLVVGCGGPVTVCVTDPEGDEDGGA